MELSIKKHIINNFIEDNDEEIKKAIEESINNGDEELLPGLGVFMELLWKCADSNTKEKIVKLIVRGIKEEKEITD